MSFQLILSPFYIIWIGKQTLATSMKLELLQYIICGMLYTFIYVVCLFKKQVIISNYTLIETDFRNWSLIKGTNQNRAYEQNIRNVRKLTKPYIVMTIFTLFGPLLSTINDIGKKPIDHHSHFLLFWPKVSPPPRIIYNNNYPIRNYQMFHNNRNMNRILSCLLLFIL